MHRSILSNVVIDCEDKEFFSAFGLASPPVPEKPRDGLASLRPGVFGTRADTPGPAQIEWFRSEFMAGKTEQDYLVLGWKGMG
ncbi:MAG TPA: hypothetical protein VH186_36475 [Chloroflexia bacterium]|nr:hypothetical protein [Chloroflexia bacterium]